MAFANLCALLGKRKEKKKIVKRKIKDVSYLFCDVFLLFNRKSLKQIKFGSNEKRECGL